MTEASFELGRGTPLTTAAVGKTIVHRPTRDVGFPLVFGAICGALALGLLAAAVVPLASFVVVPAMLLVLVELALAVGLGWLAVVLLRDAWAARRFNRRRYEVSLGLERVELHSVDGVEPLAFADMATHPLLRAMPILGQAFTLVQVRDACRGLPPRDDVRVVLETLAVEPPEGMEVSEDGSAAPPYYAMLFDGEAGFTRRDDDIESLRQEGVPIYRIDTEWETEAQCSVPRLTPAAVRRV